MEQIRQNYREIWQNKPVLRNMFASMLLFLSSMYITMLAYNYTKAANMTVVPDLILDNIPALNVGALFFLGFLFLIIFAVAVGLVNPRRIPFLLISTSLFFSIRSFFMVLTHLAPPNIEYYQYIEHEHHVRTVLFTLSSGTDLFFSGHTGYPFLLALITWGNKWMRTFFIVFSIFMAIVVLVGHLHYSIDVFAAYFISYGIFKLAERFFPKEYQLSILK